MLPKCIVGILRGVILFILFPVGIGCKKLVDVAPPATSATRTNVYKNDATAVAVLSGIYSNMSSSFSGGGLPALSLLPSLSADELSMVYLNFQLLLSIYYTNALTSANINSNGLGFWDVCYPVIYTTNEAIEGLEASNSLLPSVKKQLLGEAKFMRAFCYFYLVNLYGDVPLVTSTDYTVNAILPRTAKEKVYTQIIADLKSAQDLLSKDYLGSSLQKTTNERIRPSYWAATSLLARTYLYTNTWDSAKIQATAIISQTSLFGLSSLDTTFLANNKEAIWQLQPVSYGYNTLDAVLFILPSSGPSFSYPVFLDTLLVKDFEPGDQRFQHWVGTVTPDANTYYYPNKYKKNLFPSDVTEYTMVFRLAEQYLIRAEARAELGDPGAVDDLNAVRSRAGLMSYSGNADKASLLTAIFHERRVEMFTEWANRWMDLKRSGSVDQVMSIVCPLKGGSWNSNKQWYPIPLADLKADPFLVQNAGY